LTVATTVTGVPVAMLVRSVPLVDALVRTLTLQREAIVVVDAVGAGVADGVGVGVGDAGSVGVGVGVGAGVGAGAAGPPFEKRQA
jgi:hypothetical protein